MNVRSMDMRAESMRRYGFGYDAMRQLKVCTYCGRAAPSSQTFCRVCGKPLPEDSLYETLKKSHRCCQRCETVVPVSARFCPQCGARLKEEK